MFIQVCACGVRREVREDIKCVCGLVMREVEFSGLSLTEQFITKLGVQVPSEDLQHLTYENLGKGVYRWYVNRAHYLKNARRIQAINRQLANGVKSKGFRWEVVHTSFGCEYRFHV